MRKSSKRIDEFFKNEKKLRQIKQLSEEDLRNCIKGGEALTPEQQYVYAKKAENTNYDLPPSVPNTPPATNSNSGGNSGTGSSQGVTSLTTEQQYNMSKQSETGNKETTKSDYNTNPYGSGYSGPQPKESKEALSPEEQYAKAKEQEKNASSIPDPVPTEYPNGGDYPNYTNEDGYPRTTNYKSKKTLIERIEATIAELGQQQYRRPTKANNWFQFMCDNTSQYVFTNSGCDISNAFAGPATQKTCAEHIEYLKKTGNYTNTIPTIPGVYSVMMGDGKEYTKTDKTTAIANPHAAILVVKPDPSDTLDNHNVSSLYGENEDKKYLYSYVFDNCSNNSTGGTDFTYGKTPEDAIKQFSLYETFYFTEMKLSY